MRKKREEAMAGKVKKKKEYRNKWRVTERDSQCKL